MYSELSEINGEKDIGIVVESIVKMLTQYAPGQIVRDN